MVVRWQRAGNVIGEVLSHRRCAGTGSVVSTQRWHGVGGVQHRLAVIGGSRRLECTEYY